MTKLTSIQKCKLHGVTYTEVADGEFDCPVCMDEIAEDMED